MESGKIVTVFGSSRAKKGGKPYEEAYQLGKLLAQAGFIVCNGGYGGLMEASARGAKEAGGKTVGITTEVFGNSSPNLWLDVESRAESYTQRLMIMTSVADAFIVLKGGIGTLAEMTFVWTLTAVGELRKPIILVGDAWQKTVDDLSKRMLIRDRDTQILKMVKTAEEAAEWLDEFWSDR
ncbi:LOG family protein [Candidatus Poribacteria bacterium]